MTSEQPLSRISDIPLSEDTAWMERVQAVVDEAHEENLGGKHRMGFCEACADAYLVAQRAVPRTPPLTGPSLRRRWKPGEYVAHVSRPEGPYGAEHLRRGVVVSVDGELRRVERLKVRFDDGEERYINSDVMRHV